MRKLEKYFNKLAMSFSVLFVVSILYSQAIENKNKTMAVVHNGCNAVEHTGACFGGGMPRKLTCKTLPCQ